MAKLLALFVISLVRAEINLKEILTSHKSMDAVFEELLVRKNTPHIMLSDTKEIIGAIKKEFPEFIEVKSIGNTWE